MPARTIRGNSLWALGGIQRAANSLRELVISKSINEHKSSAVDYALTQNIGAALAFLGLDGLIAPSARWPCDNLMIYQTNYRFLTERLEVIEEEQMDWGAWARANDLLPEEPAPPSR